MSDNGSASPRELLMASTQPGPGAGAGAGAGVSVGADVSVSVSAATATHELFEAWIGLSALDGIGAGTMWQIEAQGGLEAEWQRLIGGGPPSFRVRQEHRATWARHLSSAAVEEVRAQARRHVEFGVTLTRHGTAAHPSIDIGDPHVPAVLAWLGSPVGQESPRVGIVGTRRASRLGAEIASELAAELTRRGVAVVSGLAAGIDAAAHRGALSRLGSSEPGRVAAAGAPTGAAAPIGVVGTGLDVAYPQRNTDLYERVSSVGALCSEYPLGTAPAPWRFPARNRILVALCDVLVVVESRSSGGSLITAGIAGERGVPVLAVPGSIRSHNATGTNRLIADGCAPCLGVDDVLDVLGQTTPSVGHQGASRRGHDIAAPEAGSEAGNHSAVGHGPSSAPAALSATELDVLDALGWEPASIEMLAIRCSALSLGEVTLAVQQLLRSGAVVDSDGWIERRR